MREDDHDTPAAREPRDLFWPVLTVVALIILAAWWFATDWADPCTGQFTNLLGCLMGGG